MSIIGVHKKTLHSVWVPNDSLVTVRMCDKCHMPTCSCNPNGTQQSDRCDNDGDDIKKKLLQCKDSPDVQLMKCRCVQSVDSVHWGWLGSQLERLLVRVSVLRRVHCQLVLLPSVVSHRHDHRHEDQSRRHCHGLQKSETCATVLSFLGERYYITFALWHEPSVCRL